MGPAPRIDNSRFEIIGQDGGQSIPLDDGRSLFVFSDTLLRAAPRSDGSGSASRGLFLPNCAAIGRGSQLIAALRSSKFFEDDAGLPRPLLPATVIERLQRVRFWPEHGIAVGGRVYLYYLGIHHFDDRETWSFKLEGSGLAVLDIQTGEAVRVEGPRGWALWPAGEEKRHFGVQVLRSGEHALIYVTVATDLGRRARLYRAPLADLTNLARYQRLASVGAGASAAAPVWSSADSPDRQAHDLGPCGTECSVSFNPQLGGYLMCYVAPDDGSLQLRLAKHPWGPFSAPVNAGVLPRSPGSELVYLGFQHPQFAEQDGQTILVSYCQPHFVRNQILKVSFA
ncbi:MAG: DUF4185 domain-containing protein [Enhygromyxa sp.]